jgi:hypothetical protein
MSCIGVHFCLSLLASSVPRCKRLLTVQLLGTTIHRVYLNPLARVPGPFLAKVTCLPSFYHAIKGDRHIWIWQCFQIYGEQDHWAM